MLGNEYILNRSGIAGGYLVNPFDDERASESKSNPKKQDEVPREELIVFILVVGFLQTNS